MVNRVPRSPPRKGSPGCYNSAALEPAVWASGETADARDLKFRPG